MNILEILKAFFRQKAYSYIDAETEEMERLFSFLLYGWMIGYPIPVALSSLKALPYAEKEIEKLLLIIRDMDDIFGKIAGEFDID